MHKIHILQQLFFKKIPSNLVALISFFEIIKNTSPQLGGQLRNLKDYIQILQISDGDPLLNYYQIALIMYKEINV